MWKELIKKIELQSVVVLFITILAGVLLLYKDNSFSGPAGYAGCILIGIGLLYTFTSFFSNQIKESYKDVIDEYKNTITALRASSEYIQQSYQDTLSSQSKEKTIGESYQTVGENEVETHNN